ncbi:MAG TPA: PD-(D/E)XK nuclease family protein [Lacunisphaera sp.]|nr:PD-(D/E)XK nuclease family protein [Lacunisphaera sp.]
MTPAATVRRHFLPWDKPLPGQAAAWLAGDWTGQGPLDLGAMVVIVPTRQSGRRLREALAEYAAARGSAVLAPRVILPEDLLKAEDEAGIATRIETQVAWAEVLRTSDLAEFRAVFPVDPPVRAFAWAARLAAQMMRLQSTLGENGLRLQDVVSRAGAGLPETERWLQLAELERRCDALLAAGGRKEAQAARIASARTVALPSGTTRLVLLATPDPIPLMIGVFAKLIREVQIDVVVFGPADGAGLFDEWGRPREDGWTGRPLALGDFKAQVRLCADAADQAARVVELARDYGEPAGVLAVGVADAEVAPPLEHGLRGAGLAVFNPGGRSRRQDGLYALLAALGELVKEDSFENAEALARCPDFIASVTERNELVSPAAMLAELDDLRARHLPATIAAALGHTAKRPAARQALEAMRELRAGLTGGEFPANAATSLQEIFGARRVPGSSALAEAAGVWMDVLRQAAEARRRFSGLTTAEWWELALAQFGESLRFEQRPADAVDLLGWLELLWEDAPHLVVVGLNDGRVPETVTGDAFLPEALRARLGLKTNEARFARDSYLLAALAECRRRGGRLDLLVGKVSAAGDPLRPSRLLLACDDAELPGRVAVLFRPVEAGRPGLPWRRAWRLVPPVVPAPARVSVTAFRDYLFCPFRFYLKHPLKMEPVDPFKSEMDALDFGTLCHGALEALGLDAGLRNSTDAAALREFLLAHVNRRSRDRYGAELTLPLIVQLESARQRLGRASDVLAAQRQAGWVVEHVERKFELGLGAVTVSGKIDRIERHENTGAVRVIDYKTSDKGVSPLAAHVRSARRDETAPEWARLEVAGKELVWTDLQLPLYLEALRDEYGEATAGYFNLPKAVGETGLLLWEDFDVTWRAAARRCAEGVAAQVAAGIFWPPAEVPERDEDEALVGLFHHGTADSVEWRGAS